MAKRKSNRAARHLLAQGKHAQIYRVSNRRQMNQIFDDQPGFVLETKPSRKQRRAAKALAAIKDAQRKNVERRLNEMHARKSEAQEKAQ